MPAIQKYDKHNGISKRVAAKRRLSGEREEARDVAVSRAEVEPEPEAGLDAAGGGLSEGGLSKEVIRHRQCNSQLLSSMLEVFIRGNAEGDVDGDGLPIPRAARLCEELWRLATRSDDDDMWNGILFRQTFARPDDMFRQARLLYFPLGADERKAESRFVFPNGARITFRYLEHDDDVLEYRGHNYTWIGFDEPGNYRSGYVRDFMMMCPRSARVSEERLRIRGTGNPGGYGYKWLKKRFIEGFEPCGVFAPGRY